MSQEAKFEDAKDAKLMSTDAAIGAMKIERPFPRPAPGAADEECDDDPAEAEFVRSEAVRLLNTDLHFWHACPSRRCRRHRSCCGDDADACLDLFWPVVPAEFKVWWQAIVQAKHDRASIGQARSYARDEVAGWWRRQQRSAV